METPALTLETEFGAAESVSFRGRNSKGSNNDSCELSAEIERLHRRVERERQARLDAEAIAERGLRELYDRHQGVKLLHAIALAVGDALGVEEALSIGLSRACEHIGWQVGHAYMVSSAGRKLISSRVCYLSNAAQFSEFRRISEEMEFVPGAGLPGRVWSTHAPDWIANLEQETGFVRREIAISLGLKCGFAVPIVVQGEIFAVIEFYSTEVRERDDHLLDIVTQVGYTLGRTVERLQAEEATRRQVARMRSLHTIDIAITASLDLELTLSVFLDQVLSLLAVDAAEVLLYNPYGHSLRHAHSKGFRSSRPTSEIRLGQGHAGVAALRRKMVHFSDLRRIDDTVDSEGFIGYIAVPLLAKGHVKGVLQIFRRSELRCDKDLVDFIEALARQAAIAVDNATLFDEIQRSNVELSLAYDATIEGWSRALDLRDKETEGHTRRVTEGAVSLARAMDVSEAELIHLRRGALLHDIGKMGIPDSILHKPGPLDEEEWATMKTHPVLAYEMLFPVEFLRPALDIPYGHHEKWDGTGYPRGIKGEDIPLAARIFAIIDVWDALRSDRPYKKGWSFERALDYVVSQAGRHFDPHVVERFVEMKQEEASRDRRI